MIFCDKIISKETLFHAREDADSRIYDIILSVLNDLEWLWAK